MFRLNRNKQEANRNSLIGSIFCYFLQKCRVFPIFFDFFRVFFSDVFVFFGFFVFSVFSVCFETVCFGCFASIPKQRVSIEPKQTEDPPKQFKRDYLWTFFQKFRVVSFVTKQICLKLRYEASQVWMNATFIPQGQQSSV